MLDNTTGLLVFLSALSLASLLILSCKEDGENKASNVETASSIIDSLRLQKESKEQLTSMQDTKATTQPQVDDSLPQLESIDIADRKPSSSAAVKEVADRKPKKNKPKYQGRFAFENDVYNFGEINAGEIIEHQFAFTNTGKGAINIKDAEVTCGCTYPSFPFVAVEPGDTALIKVRYNSVGKKGPQEARITINSDALQSPYYLYLKGVVNDKPLEEQSKDTTKTD